MPEGSSVDHELQRIAENSKVEQPAVSPVVNEVRESTRGPHTRYKVSLAELVSKIVASKPQEFAELQDVIKENFDLADTLEDTLNVDDWEKALNDEAKFQFSSRYRPVVEAILNGLDSEHRKEARSGITLKQKSVDVEISERGFVIQDHGEGMKLETVLERLLVPKLTGNMAEKSDVIGRFGVGFYSLLSYLKEPGDTVIVRTTDGQEGWRVSIGYYSGDTSPRGKFTVVISPLLPIDQDILQQGTEVELHVNDFAGDSAREYIEDTLKYKPDGEIRVNNQRINDPGRYHVDEKEVVLPTENRERTLRIIEEETESTPETIICVGGVRVESFVSATPLSKRNLILDLPPSVSLPKSRDKLEVSLQTLEVMREAMELIFAGNEYEVAEKITAFAPLIEQLQQRNPFPKKDTNLMQQFIHRVNAWKKNHQGVLFLPDVSGVDSIDIDGAIALDQRFIDKELNSLRSYEAFVGNQRAYVAPFFDETVLVSSEKGVIFNERYLIDDPRQLGMLNAYIEIYNIIQQQSKGKGMVDGKFYPITRQQKKEHVSTQVNDDEPQVPLIPESPPLIQEARDELSEVKGYEYYDDYEEVPYPLPERYQNRVPRTLHEVQQMWIEQVAEDYIRHLLTDNKRSWGENTIPADQTYWEAIITDDFYEFVRERVSLERPKEVLEAVLNYLPPRLHSFYSDHGTKGTESLSRELDNLAKSPAILLDLEEAQKVLFCSVGLGVAERIETYDELFEDEAFWHAVLNDPEMTEIKKELFEAHENGIYPHSLENLLSWGTTEHFMNKIAGILSETKSSRDRIQLMKWYERNHKLYEHYRYADDSSQNDESRFRPVFSSCMQGPYIVGMDGENDWGIFEENIAKMDEFLRNNPDLKDTLFKKRKLFDDYELPPAELFGIGPINVDNLQFMAGILNEHDEEFAAKEYSFVKRYRELLFPYLSLPPELFKRYSNIIVELFQKSADRDIRTPGNFSYPFLDEPSAWKSELKRERAAAFVTPEIMERRLELLEDLEPEFAAIYFLIQSKLAGQQIGSDRVSYQEYFLNVEDHVAKVIQRLAEMPYSKSRMLLKSMESAFGYHYISTQHLVDNHLLSLSPELKPWVYYLLSETDIDVKPTETFFDDSSSSLLMSGSDLIARYFTKDNLKQVSTYDELCDVVGDEISEERAKELGQRRIEHAVNYQGTDGYLWLRELVQNAYNATRTDGVDKSVAIENYLQDDHFNISVTDPKGMDMNTVINSLLIPQRSNWGGESLGYFGHGFFTVFKSADKVRIKTGIGNGKVQYIEVMPMKNQDRQKVMDLDIQIQERDEDWQGTAITWMKRTDMPEFEAARAKTELETAAGLMPPQDLKIIWNESQINKGVPFLTQIGTPLGNMRVFASPERKAMTVHGLYIKDIDEEVKAMIPVTIRDFLLDQGITLDLPGSVRLIDSRADIANRSEVLRELQPSITEASVRAAVDMFAQGNVDLSRIPYDFFSEAWRMESRMDAEIIQDAYKLGNHETIETWDQYFGDNARLTQLLLAMPAVMIGEEKMSILQIVRKAQDEPEFLTRLPVEMKKLASLIRNAVDQQQIITKEQRDTFNQRGYANLSDFVPTETPVTADVYPAWLELCRQMLRPAIDKTGKDYQGTFYSTNEASIAHHVPYTYQIGWNLVNLDGTMKLLSQILKDEAVADGSKMELYKFLAEVGSHEYQHRLENKAESLTHNIYFYKGQQAILERIISTMSPDIWEAAVKWNHLGGYIPTSEYSQMVAKLREQ